MRPVQPPPSVEVSSAIELFLFQSLYPDAYARSIEPWERLVRKPIWRHAKSLMREGPDQEVRARRVSHIVERVVGDMTGTRPSDALMCLGKVRQAAGNHEDAITVFHQLVDRGWPDRHKAMFNVGLCLAALGRFDEARKSFERVLDLVPGDERATRALADLP